MRSSRSTTPRQQFLPSPVARDGRSRPLAPQFVALDEFRTTVVTLAIHRVLRARRSRASTRGEVTLRGTRKISTLERTRVSHHPRFAVSTLVVATIVLAPTIAAAIAPANVTRTSPTPRHAPSALATTACARVSAARVSSIVGYRVPAGKLSVVRLKATKSNFETSGVETTCIYGSQSNLSALLKAVTLTYDVLTKPITASEFQRTLSRVTSSAKFKFTSYRGLGVPSFYFSLSVAGITGRGIIGEQKGTRYFGASVEQKGLSKSKIAALAKLAEQL